MSVIFKVLESAGRPETYFAYTGAADQIGEPSVYGTVYRSYRSDGSGNPLAPGEVWVIKESKSADYRQDFQFEYQILRDLAQVSERQNGRAFSPQPVYLLERLDTGMPALAMPFYGAEVEREIFQWSQFDLLRVMLEYVRLLMALKNVGPGYTCTDRKQDDLRWYQGHLVVIDWNLLRDATPQYIQTEISIFGRLWYSMLTGRIPTATLNAFDDAYWQPVTATDSPLVRDLLLGTRLLITRTVQSYYTSLEALEAALRTWAEAVNQGLPAGPALQTGLQISEVKARALVIDLNPNRLPPEAYRAERSAALSTVLQQDDPLGDIQASLDQVGESFRRVDIQAALDTLNTLTLANATQRAAGARWRLLLTAVGSATASERQDVRQFADRWRNALERLLNRPWNEHLGTVGEPLARAEDEYRSSAQRFTTGALQAALVTLATEARLRRDMAQVEQAMQRGENPVEALQALDRLRLQVPYADLMMESFDLAGRLAAAQQSRDVSAQLDAQVAQARAAVLDWLRQWNTPEASSNEEALARIKQFEDDASGLAQTAGVDVTDRLLVYRSLVLGLPRLREQLPADVVQFSQRFRPYLDQEMAVALETQLDRLICAQSQAIADRVEQVVRGVEKPTPEINFKPEDILWTFNQAQALTPEIIRKLPLNLQQQLATYVPYLERQNAFFQQLISPTAVNTFDVLEQAKQARVSLYHPALWDYTQRALEESKDKQTSLTQKYVAEAEGLKNQVSSLYSDLTRELTGFKRSVDGQVDAVKTDIAAHTQSISDHTMRLNTLDEKATSAEAAIKGRAPRFLIYVVAALAVLAVAGGILLVLANGQTNTQVAALDSNLATLDVTITAQAGQQAAFAAEMRALSTQQNDLQGTMSGVVQTLTLLPPPTATPTPIPTLPPTNTPDPAHTPEGTPETTVGPEASSEPATTTGEATQEATPQATSTPAEPVTAKDYPVAVDELAVLQAFGAAPVITVPFKDVETVQFPTPSLFQTFLEWTKPALKEKDGTLLLAVVKDNTAVLPVFKTGKDKITLANDVALPPNSYSFIRSDNTVASYKPDISLPAEFKDPLDVVLLPVDETLRAAVIANLGARQLPGDAPRPINDDYVLALVSSKRLIEIWWGDTLISFARWTVTPSSPKGFVIRSGPKLEAGQLGAVVSGVVSRVAVPDDAGIKVLGELSKSMRNLLFTKNAAIFFTGTEQTLSDQTQQWWYLEAEIDGSTVRGWSRQDTFNPALALELVPAFPLNNSLPLGSLVAGS